MAGRAKIVYDSPVRTMRKILGVAAFGLLLVSCVDIDTRIRFQGDGSGTVTLTYRVSHLVVDLGKGGEASWSVPLPITQEDFQRSIAGAPGVRLTGFTRGEDEKDVKIKAELSFDKVESLAQVESFRSSEPAMSLAGSDRTYRQVVLRAEKEPVSADSLAMLDALFKDYAISFAIETPRSIREHNIGTVGGDGRTWTWKTTVKDLIQSRTDTAITLSW